MTYGVQVGGCISSAQVGNAPPCPTCGKQIAALAAAPSRLAFAAVTGNSRLPSGPNSQVLATHCSHAQVITPWEEAVMPESAREWSELYQRWVTRSGFLKAVGIGQKVDVSDGPAGTQCMLTASAPQPCSDKKAVPVWSWACRMPSVSLTAHHLLEFCSWTTRSSTRSPPLATKRFALFWFRCFSLGARLCDACLVASRRAPSRERPSCLVLLLCFELPG